MPRKRISTTVNEELLAEARDARSGLTDAALIDEALAALLTANRRSEIDAQYAAYDELPLSTPDEWGNVEAFLDAAAGS